MDICDFIAFPSYPEIFDKNGDRPIMRTGSIASDPESDFFCEDMKPGRRIAYEAFSTNGSSGAPVFALPKGMLAGEGLKGGYFREGMLIGINSGHLTAADKRLSLMHSGVSFCYKSTCILELLEQV